ncbi:hypothetical protein, partial [Xanthomonas axonopodis]|uniref:hypothetical protein n=1 Tax=Xanthomonas axonopodis TaxID=53413 RepID=UPI001C261FF4
MYCLARVCSMLSPCNTVRTLRAAHAITGDAEYPLAGHRLAAHARTGNLLRPQRTTARRMRRAVVETV